MNQSRPILLDDYLTSWKKAFLADLTKFDRSQVRLFLGIRVGIMVIISMGIGLLTNSMTVAIFASLGVFYVSIPEGFPTKWSTMRVLSVTCLANPVVFAMATLIGLTGPVLSPLLFGLGFFFLSYLRVYRDAIPILFVASIVLAVGVGYPGGSVAAALERFWFLLGGGLLGLLGAFVSMHFHSKPVSQNMTHSDDHHPPSPLEEKPRPFANNLSVRSMLFKTSVVFAIAGTAGLAIAQYLGLSRDYWVVMTVALLLLRDNVLITFSYIPSRVAGTIIAAVIVYGIIAIVYNQSILVLMLFLFATAFYALRGISYLLSTFFITLFVLVLISISSPGNTSVVQIRVVDTLIGAAISLIAVSTMIASHRSLSTNVWEV